MSCDFDVKGLGGRLYFHRRRLGFTQTMLAEKLNISFQAISNWENSISIPDIVNLCKLSEILGVSLDDLLKENSLGSSAMIGVDGGGTKTEFLLFEETGKVLKRVRLSGTNSSLVGLDETIRILEQGIDSCLAENLFVGGVFVGVAGGKLDLLSKKLSEHYPKIKIRVESDGVNALNCAEGDFALICGTGSIIITKEGEKYRRIGGWGARFGDPGSAYNFGRSALRSAFAYEDGIAERSLLYDLLLKETGFSVLRPSIGGVDVPYIANLARVVFEAYGKGCPVAQKIIQSEMKDLAELLDSAFCDGGRAIICGGVMEHQSAVLLPVLKGYLKAPFEFTKPTLPPVYGACVACCDEMGISRPSDFEKNFKNDYFNISGKKDLERKVRAEK